MSQGRMVQMAADLVRDQLEAVVAAQVDAVGPDLVAKCVAQVLEEQAERFRGPKGDAGEQGPRGLEAPSPVGIQGASLENHCLIVHFTDGSHVNVGRIRGETGPRGQRGHAGGPRGPRGKIGPPGPQGEPGVPEWSYRGKHEPGGTYEPGDVVELQGSSVDAGYYQALRETRQAPPGSDWRFILPGAQIMPYVHQTVGGGNPWGQPFFCNHGMLGNVDMPIALERYFPVWATFGMQQIGEGLTLDPSGETWTCNIPGVYEFNAFICINGGGFIRYVQSYLNGSFPTYTKNTNAISGVAADSNINHSWVIRLSEGDQVGVAATTTQIDGLIRGSETNIAITRKFVT